MSNTQKIPPICPSLSRWFGEASENRNTLGTEGPVPAASGMTNVQVFGLLFSRNGGAFTLQWGTFEGPFGLTMLDAVTLSGLLMYARGHLDACGMPQDEQQELLASALEPEIKQYMEQNGISGDAGEAEENNEIHD